MGEHALFSPSSMTRVINCPGSFAATRDIEPNESSEYAKEGTAAHLLASIAYIARLPTHQVLSTVGQIAKLKGEYAELRAYRQYLNDEMYEHTQYYVDICNRIRDSIPVIMRIEHVEQRVNIDWVHPDLWGTADLILGSCLGDLHVIDFKYGKNVVVEVFKNNQLMIYALGAIGPINKNHHGNILIHIVQPRAAHPDGGHRIYQLRPQELYTWQEDVLRPAIHHALSPNPPFKAGDWCKWCPAAPNCRTLAEEAYAVARVEFADMPVASSDLPAPADLSPAEIARVLAFKEILNSWADQVKEYAVGLMKSGHDLPGFKLVAKRSIRQWTDPDAVEALLGPNFGHHIFEPPKLKSPAKMEKVVGDKQKHILEAFWEKPDAGVTIAPSSDRRKAVAPPAVIEFAT